MWSSVRRKHERCNGGLGSHPRSSVCDASRWLSYWLTLISLLLSVSPGWPHDLAGIQPSRMIRQPIEGKAPEFTLVNQSGQPVALRDLRGKVVLLTFTYSSCTGVCPLIGRSMTVLQQRLTSQERRKIFFLSVTVDPEVDTPATLRTYAKRHGVDLTSWAFLTESPTVVREVWQSFGMTVNERAKGIVDHPGWTFLIDREGMVRYRYLGGALEVKTVLEDMRKL